MNKYICEKCKKEYSEKYFYTHKNKERDLLCKKCRTEGINDLTPSTFLPIMEYFDIPFWKEQWYALLGKAIKKATETGVYCQYGEDIPITIFGKYLSTMKLRGNKNYHYEDSNYLNSFHTEKEYFFCYTDEQGYGIVEEE